MNIVAPAIRARGDEPRLRKAAIARSFDAAAEEYDSHAAVQRRVADRLAARVAEHELPNVPRVLDIGCGTGFLGEALLRRNPEAELLCTDLAPAMARRCRAKIGPAKGLFAVMDGELPAVAPVFDLIVSSFAFQWFLGLGTALGGLAACLKPGGRLVFATLGAESLSEWRTLQQTVGAGFPGLNFPDAGALRRLAARDANLRGAVTEERIRLTYADVPAFLHELKSLGAGAVPGAPANLGALRRVLRANAAWAPFPVTYHILYGSFAAAEPEP